MQQLQSTSSKLNLRQAFQTDRLRIGELLLLKQAIGPAELQAALARQRVSRRPLGEVLVEAGYITRAQLRQVLWEQRIRNAIAASLLALGTALSAIPQVANAQAIDTAACQRQEQQHFTPAAYGRETIAPSLGWVPIGQGRIRPQLRERPSTRLSRVITHLRPGHVMAILDRLEGWYRVEIDGRCGFIAASDIEVWADPDGRDPVPLHNRPSVAQPLRGFSHPLAGAGYVSQGPSGFATHRGRAEFSLDFAVKLGTPVYAMRAGRVVGLEDRFPDSGSGAAGMHRVNYIWIEHEGGYRSAYGHLQQGFRRAVGIEVGDRVAAGERIGYSGNSGYSTAPHLHVEVHRLERGTFGQSVPFQIDRLVTPPDRVELALQARDR
ncbi:M23 family metallopeptidase [Synechococcus sp. PCC 7336]|uniref:M23 family metallopeptidase n=1 Tax=Synechococcus sp. PCC 7336 TaxID=195250 RepID=UPI00037BD432|nr:M23 family metallopeptidase [Synechococcus sp. PCC 7336]